MAFFLDLPPIAQGVFVFGVFGIYIAITIATNPWRYHR